jgi:hypothetical protein
VKTTPRTYSSATSIGDATEAIAVLGRVAANHLTDAMLFLAMALVWGAVFYLVLSSKL